MVLKSMFGGTKNPIEALILHSNVYKWNFYMTLHFEQKIDTVVIIQVYRFAR